jgi:hypothetical protein
MIVFYLYPGPPSTRYLLNMRVFAPFVVVAFARYHVSKMEKRAYNVRKSEKTMVNDVSSISVAEIDMR